MGARCGAPHEGKLRVPSPGGPAFPPAARGSRCLSASASALPPRPRNPEGTPPLSGGKRECPRGVPGPLASRRARLTTPESSRAAEPACQRSPPSGRLSGPEAPPLRDTSLPPGCAGPVAQLSRLAHGKMGSSAGVRLSQCGSAVELGPRNEEIAGSIPIRAPGLNGELP